MPRLPCRSGMLLRSEPRLDRHEDTATSCTWTTPFRIQQRRGGKARNLHCVAQIGWCSPPGGRFVNRGDNAMNRFLTAGCVAAVLTATPIAAQAADAVPPYRAPMAIIYDWTGFYVGAHVGFIDTDGPSGVLGGGQAGFNYQVGHWVFGAEGQISATSIKETFDFGMMHTESSLDWVSTLAGRAGYAFDRWLVYGKLGGAWAHGSGNVSFGFPGLRGGSFSSTVSGWMLGVGTEYALRDNWSVKLEYNRMEFDPGTINVVKAGVNYRFNFFDSRRY
jgi:opacity protein-like surface antigen